MKVVLIMGTVGSVDNDGIPIESWGFSAGILLFGGAVKVSGDTSSTGGIGGTKPEYDSQEIENSVGAKSPPFLNPRPHSCTAHIFVLWL